MFPGEAQGAVAVATDAVGNSYMVGSYDSHIAFGGVPLNSVGSHDIFIVKYDTYGNTLWVKNIQGNNEDNIKGVRLDAAGFVYVTGYTRSLYLFFGSTMYSNPYISSVPNYSMFLAKYDTSGNIVWVKFAGGLGAVNTYGINLVTDSKCNIYVLGSYSFGNTTFDTITISHTSSVSDVFLAKYDSSGNIKWVKSGQGINKNQGTSLCLDPSGNIVITGNTKSPNLNFNGTILNIVGAATYAHIFIAKYDSLGNLSWAKSFGSSNDDNFNCVATYRNSDIYISGAATGSSIMFDTITLSTAASTTFLVRFDSNGNAINVTGGIFGGKITIDSIGNKYGISSCCYSKYDSSGFVQWSQPMYTTTYNNEEYDFSVTNYGIYIVGNFQDATIALGSTILIDSTTSYADVLYAKLAEPPVSINFKTYNNEIGIFPNPSIGKFKVVLPSVGENTTLAMYDYLGRIVYRTTVFANSIELDLNLSPGVYYLKAGVGNTLYTKKISIY